MNPNKALPAILDDHLGARFPPRFHRSKLSKRALGEANFALGFKLFQDVGESQLRIEALFGRADFRDGLSAIRDQQGLTVADGAQIASEAVFEFAAANPLHVATSITIVATKARGGNDRLSFRVRPSKEEAEPSLRPG